MRVRNTVSRISLAQANLGGGTTYPFIHRIPPATAPHDALRAWKHVGPDPIGHALEHDVSDATGALGALEHRELVEITHAASCGVGGLFPGDDCGTLVVACDDDGCHAVVSACEVVCCVERLAEGVFDKRREFREVDERGGERRVAVDGQWDAVLQQRGEGALVGGGIDWEG